MELFFVIAGVCRRCGVTSHGTPSPELTNSVPSALQHQHQSRMAMTHVPLDHRYAVASALRLVLFVMVNDRRVPSPILASCVSAVCVFNRHGKLEPVEVGTMAIGITAERKFVRLRPVVPSVIDRRDQVKKPEKPSPSMAEVTTLS